MTAIMDTLTERLEFAGASAAGDYQWVDAQGVAHYGDRAMSMAAKQRAAQRKAQCESPCERQADDSVRSPTEEALQPYAQDTAKRIAEVFANAR